MRFLAFIEYSAAIVGIVAVLAGQFFALPKGFHLGVFLIGAGILRAVACPALVSVWTI